MIQEDYVTFEQAKLLKENGFPQDVDGLFPDRTLIVFSDEPNNIIDYNSASIQGFLDDDYLSVNGIKWYVVPTLSLVQKWLREEKKINLWVAGSYNKTDYPYTWNYTSRWDIEEDGDELPYNNSKEWFKTYENALSAGINKTLEFLK